jgi:hypothetical protein
VSLKTILGYLSVAFVLWWVIEAPSSAAHLVHNISTFLTTVAAGLSSFFTGIGGGGKGHQSSLPGWEAWLIILGIIAGILFIAWLILWIVGGTGRKE